MGETRKWVKRLVVLVVVAWLKTRWWRGKAARIQRGAAACWACFSRLLGAFQPPAGRVSAACWAAVGVKRGSGAAWRCFRGRLGCSAGMEGCGSERGKKRKRKKEEK